MAGIVADRMTEKCLNVNTIWNSNLFIALLVQFESRKLTKTEVYRGILKAEEREVF